MNKGLPLFILYFYYIIYLLYYIILYIILYYITHLLQVKIYQPQSEVNRKNKFHSRLWESFTSFFIFSYLLCTDL